MKAAFACFLTAFLVLIAPPAHPQAQGRLTVSPNRVGVGEPFHVRLEVNASDEANPSAPKLALPKGLELRAGPAIGTSTNIQLGRGGLQRSYTVSLTWTVTASKTGSFTVGPASFELGGTVVEGSSKTVKVTKDAPRRRGRRRRNDPFGNFPDPFGGFPSNPNFPDFPDIQNFPGFRDRVEPLVPPAPPEARVDSAPDPRAFVRLVVTPDQAVVGEQVRAQIFVYGKGRPFRVTSLDNPARPDFLTFPLAEPDTQQELTSTEIDGENWYVRKIADNALFPLHAGRLTLDGIGVSIDGLGFNRGRRTAIERTAEPVTVDVTAPPSAGRPAGYELGDVGAYRLTAEVTPRSTSLGGSVAVTARLSGSGNVPSALKVPHHKDVEWLKPTITEKLTPSGHAVTGYREFLYLARPTREGAVVLGSLTLPYWNPSRGRYEVATADLGTVVVTAGTTDAAEAQVKTGLDLLGPPRHTLAVFTPTKARFTDAVWFWLLVFGGPVIVALTYVTRLLSKGNRRPSVGGPSPRNAQREMARAKAAAKNGQLRDAAAHAERGVQEGVEVATGVNPRGMLRTELEGALRERGVSPEVARSVCHVLESSEAARFTMHAGDSAGDAQWVEQADRVLGDLLATSRGKKR